MDPQRRFYGLSVKFEDDDDVQNVYHTMDENWARGWVSSKRRIKGNVFSLQTYTLTLAFKNPAGEQEGESRAREIETANVLTLKLTL